MSILEIIVCIACFAGIGILLWLMALSLRQDSDDRLFVQHFAEPPDEIVSLGWDEAPRQKLLRDAESD